MLLIKRVDGNATGTCNLRFGSRILYNKADDRFSFFKYVMLTKEILKFHTETINYVKIPLIRPNSRFRVFVLSSVNFNVL